MKATVVREFENPLQIEEIPVKRPACNEILVKVTVWHTGLHAANGDWPVKPTLSLIHGHEDLGYVVVTNIGVPL